MTEEVVVPSWRPRLA